ncbi:lipopolysaccharide biosynthesis protein [Aquipuribacter nitratireducens]|uniref:Lipopolysaccharide biosynthesis protein n=1 Tax=Aquipuribacter nitratireducens TaxID=650104 RepID=A0ABW0GQC5_9MICO
MTADFRTRAGARSAARQAARREARHAARDAALERPEMAGAGGRSARGIAWNVGTQGIAYAVRLASIPVLARILSPDDYGLVAIVTAITGLVTVVGTLGISEAVIQRPRIDHAQSSTLFWLNVALGTVLMLLAMASAPLVALAFGREELLGITLATATSFALAGLGVQHHALLMRRLQYRQVAIRQGVSVVFGILASVAAALLGAGYWALVIQVIVQTGLGVALAWAAVPWRPGPPRRRSGIGGMLHFGGGVSSFHLVNYVGKNADAVVIGAFLGAPPVGLYSRAYNLLHAPLEQVLQPVANVMRPTLGALWGDDERYRRYYLTVVAGLSYVCMPLVLVLVVLADDVVAIMLGPQWTEAVPVFRWLSIAGLAGVVGYTNGWLYATSGRAWQWARWALVSRPIGIAGFFVGTPWGIEGVAAVTAVIGVALAPVGLYLAGRGTPVSLVDVIGSVVRPFLVAAAMAGAALGSALLLDEQGAVVTVLVAGSVAAAVGVLLAAAWPRVRREVADMWRTLTSRASGD